MQSIYRSTFVDRFPYHKLARLESKLRKARAAHNETRIQRCKRALAPLWAEYPPRLRAIASADDRRHYGHFRTA